MANSQRTYITNDLVAVDEVHVFTQANVGTLNGAVEFAFVAPAAGELDERPLDISVGTNTTHDTTPSITATLEKNGDGGTNMLATAPVLLNTAGVGFASTANAGTGVTQAARSATAANYRFAEGDLLFVTLTEAGSGGTDPSDVAVAVRWHPLTDNDPSSIVARS